jgi:Di-haem oxidoreductase, putative peroxidase
MPRTRLRAAATAVASFALVLVLNSCGIHPAKPPVTEENFDNATRVHADRMFSEGQEIFRFDTFGSEVFWTGTRLHQAIAGAKNGGVGPGVSPKTALALGLKVDMFKVPPGIATLVATGKADMDDPGVTVALLRANAVVGVKGIFDEGGKTLQGIGITCALCHSTVDDKLQPGIGRRLDGWANRDLNVGGIVAAAPDLSAFAKLLQVDEATVRKVLNSWGPGKYDAELSVDGKALRPDGKAAATLIPSAFGLLGVNNHTWTGAWGNVTYWNAYVANLQMHGQGTFFDPRLNDRQKYPVAARSSQGNKRDGRDLITAKLPALQYYQLSLPVPRPPKDAFDAGEARRGEALFNGKARCASCHVPPIFTEPGWNLHTADEIGIDDFQAKRSPDGRYRTEPLRALWDTRKLHKGGYYHDGRFATLRDVVDHYDRHFGTRLSDAEKTALIEYLKSI